MSNGSDVAYAQAERSSHTVPAGAARGSRRLDAEWLRDVCLQAGADDVGFVDIARPELDDQREDILAVFPRARTLISFVCRLNREDIRSPARSIANLEFHHTGDDVNDTARRIVAVLERMNVRAINPAMGFPMEMDRWPGKTWVVSHKPVAEAAGLGRMGLNRNILHPRFGNFVLLGTVVVDAEVSSESTPVDFNPCVSCKLCVAACPTGAIKPDGAFDFAACYTHNYREFMSGFTSWVETVVESKDAADYQDRVSDSESVSMWQSLSFGPNYKAAYCMSVCPAGEDVLAPFRENRKEFLDEVVRPLQEKRETVYVIEGSDAEEHVARRFPHKTAKRVSSGLRPVSVKGFLATMPHLFQRDRSRDLEAVFHFAFTGDEEASATVTLRDRTLEVKRGLHGRPNLAVTADSATWVRFLRKRASLPWALLTRRIRVKGDPRLLLAFGRCFPT